MEAKISIMRQIRERVRTGGIMTRAELKEPSPETTRRARIAQCFERGSHLATYEKNYDYAHAMFSECVLNYPGNLQFVEAMLQNLRARTPRASMWHLSRSRRPLKKALQLKDWSTVFRTGIELLKTDPWDVATLRLMADACAALHHNDVELVYLKQALDADPKSIEVNRHCARSLGRMGQFDQAIACWHRIETLKGKDAEAAKMISMLAEEKLKYPGGRPSGMQQQRSEEIKTEVPEPETESKDLSLTAQQSLENAIAQNPHNASNYLDLAKVLLETHEFNAAESVLKRAITACGEQQSLMEQLRDLCTLRAEEQRRLNEERAAVQQITSAPIRIPWMELLLAATIVLLMVQLIPSARAATWRIVDASRWSRAGWFVFNFLFLVALVAIRFGSNVRIALRQRQIRRYLTTRRKAG
jgi:tetratricopeptide (TPR) repeat protein